MKRYLRNLRHHPGVPIATAMTLMGALAGKGSPRGAIVGALVMSVFWIPVLITARHER